MHVKGWVAHVVQMNVTFVVVATVVWIMYVYHLLIHQHHTLTATPTPPLAGTVYGYLFADEGNADYGACSDNDDHFCFHGGLFREPGMSGVRVILTARPDLGSLRDFRGLRRSHAPACA